MMKRYMAIGISAWLSIAAVAAQTQTPQEQIAALQAQVAALTTALTACQGAPAKVSDPDRTKFDKVYAAGVAALNSASAPDFGLKLRELATEAAIASGKATTPAEIALAGAFQTAAVGFQLAESKQDSTEFSKAMAELTAANKVYLGR
jgi:hypothetical protein